MCFITNFTWPKFDFSCRRRCGNSGLTPVTAILFGDEIIFITAATTVVKLSTLLLVRVVVPSLRIIVTFSQERGQKTGVLLCIQTNIVLEQRIVPKLYIMK